jgi:cytidylate kinase
MKFAIHGPMCSGKTTISDIIKKYDNNYKTYSFGGKVKDIARDLFKMEGKDRSLLINVASKMREIHPDVWANYVVNEIENDSISNCIIDDLRFQNEVDLLKDWTFISLITPKEVRVKRIKELYSENYEDHLKNMNHVSETGELKLTGNVVYIDTSISFEQLEKTIINLMS